MKRIKLSCIDVEWRTGHLEWKWDELKVVWFCWSWLTHSTNKLTDDLWNNRCIICINYMLKYLSICAWYIKIGWGNKSWRRTCTLLKSSSALSMWLSLRSLSYHHHHYYPFWVSVFFQSRTWWHWHTWLPTCQTFDPMPPLHKRYGTTRVLSPSLLFRGVSHRTFQHAANPTLPFHSTDMRSSGHDFLDHQLPLPPGNSCVVRWAYSRSSHDWPPPEFNGWQ